jgi:hypothetical protein
MADYNKNAVTKPLELEVTSKNFVQKLEGIASGIDLDFNDYQKQCVFNAIRTIDPMVKANGYSLAQFDQDNVILVLQQVAFLKLNPSANPRECYFIVRKNKDKQGNELAPILEFGIEGAGNDVILTEFGRDVKAVKSYIVYEGDEFTEGYMDGWDVILPKYKRTFKTNQPKMAVYLVKRKNDEIDVLYATLDDVKKSLLAGAKQNGADDDLLREIEKVDVYTLLTDPKWLKRTIKKSRSYKGKDGKTYEKQYESPLFNPSYTAPNSRDNMIERKLRNHATRKYPKNFNQTNVKTLYEETFEEEKLYKTREVIDPEQRIEIAQQEFDSESGSQELGKDKKETPKKQVGEELIVEKETGEIIEQKVSEDEKPTFVEDVETNETLHEEETSQSVEDEELPDFLK